MKRMRVKTILLFFFCSTSLSVSQVIGHDFYNFDPQGIIQKQIMNLVQARYGAEFKYVGYTLIDSILSHYRAEKKNKFQDPYNTLKGCIVFSTYKSQEVNEPDAFIVGMIRNGKIIWDNAPGSHADLGYNLLYTKDINNDGEVDLIFIEDDREISLAGNLSLYYVYVFSWNGTRGKFLNVFREDGKSGMISEDFLKLIDENSDGIKEIEASIPNELDMDFSEYQSSIFPKIVYSWNGKQYGFWSKSK